MGAVMDRPVLQKWGTPWVNDNTPTTSVTKHLNKFIETAGAASPEPTPVKADWQD